MNPTNVISVTDLDKTYPVADQEFYALKGVNLDFKKGEFTGIVGPSGSGKTTFLNVIGTLDKPSKGKIMFMGDDISTLSAKKSAALRSAGIGFIFQTYNLLPVYTVYENLELPLILLKFSANKKREKIMQALDWVGLTDKVKSKPGALSGGQCQRVAIARAMVKEPRLVLADEPTANLDSENSHMILKTMERINKESEASFIFSTHDEKVIGYLRRKITLVDGSVASDEIITNGE